jgi:hypothetical protein
MKARFAAKTAVRGAKLHRRKQRRPFPYARLARLWEQKKTIAQIAHAIGRVDKENPKDPYHSLRNFMYQLRKHAYRGENGEILKLPYHVRTSTRKAARLAGLRAWAQHS